MEPTQIGRYRICEAIASGGMASVHFGTFAGPGGFARTVAIKRMHPHLAKDPEFLAMFVDEARVAARIRHPNVVATLDVLATADELLIVMEYAHGEPLTELMRSNAGRKARISPAVACAVASDVLSGLHAAHEATDERGGPLGIVHRDVSPDNVLVCADGSARVLDFGVAKAVGRLQVTREGQVKGKIAYMAPEQVRGGAVTRTADVYSVAVVLWEMLTGRRLFEGERDADIVEKILFAVVDAPTAVAPHVPEQLNAVVLRGLARNPADRYATARDMAQALREALRLASTSEVGDWVQSLAGETLRTRTETLAAIERQSTEWPADAPAASPASRAVPAPRRGLRVGILAVAITAVTGIGLLAARSTGTPATGMREALAPAQGKAGVDGPAVAPSATTLEPPRLVSSSPPSLATPVAASVVKSSVPAPTAVKRAARPLPSEPAECDPPYTKDADGTRRYKLKCL
jgi:serine/threonine-protein kinase